MTSSVMSVATWALFFGHDTHNTASAGSCSRQRFSAAASSARSVANWWTKRVPALARPTMRVPGGNGASHCA
jgi:hypothetical protein